MSFLKPGPMNNSQRFNRALLFAIPIGIIAGILHYAINQMIPMFRFSIIYILVGYGIGRAIQYVSHGVGRNFKYLAVGAFIISVIVSDIIIPTLMLNIDFISFLQFKIASYLSLNGLLDLLFVAFGAAAAYSSLE